jgi:hypothetical protein
MQVSRNSRYASRERRRRGGGTRRGLRPTNYRMAFRYLGPGQRSTGVAAPNWLPSTASALVSHLGSLPARAAHSRPPVARSMPVPGVSVGGGLVLPLSKRGTVTGTNAQHLATLCYVHGANREHACRPLSLFVQISKLLKTVRCAANTDWLNQCSLIARYKSTRSNLDFKGNANYLQLDILMLCVQRGIMP